MIAPAISLGKRLTASAGWQLSLLLAVMIAAAAAETIGLLSIIPLVAVALEGAAFPVFGAIDLSLEAALMLFLGAMGLRIGLGWWRDRLSASIAARFEAALGARVAAALADAPLASFAQRGRGDVQSLLGFDTPRAAAAAEQLLGLAVAVILLLVAGVAALILAPLFTLAIAGAILLLLILSIPRWRRARRDGEAIAALHVRQDEMAQRLSGAIKAAKAQASGSQLATAYRARLMEMARREQRLLHHQASGRALLLLAMAILAAGLVLVGARIMALDIVTLSAALLLYARLVQPAQAVHRTIDTIAALLPSYDRIAPLLDAPAAAQIAAPQPWRTIAAGGLVLAHGAPLFDAQDFTIERGEWVALTGASGIGKTTLVDAIAGLHPIQQGSLHVDDQPLALRADWPRHLAYVVQADLVYHDTIAANLDPERLHDHDFLHRILAVVGLKRDLDDRVTELAGGLSGGERQRLLLGRALCRRPSLMLLDEAMGAIDGPAAAALIQRVRGYDPDLAAIVVTHREDVAIACDKRIALGKNVALD